MPPSTANEDDRMETRLKLSAVAAGASAGFMGGLFLISWLSGAMSDRGLHAFTINSNASLCLLFCGIALALAVFEHPRAGRLWSARISAASAAAIAGLTLLEHILDVDLHINRLLALEQAGRLVVLLPDRMGPPGALSFTLCGIGILLLLRRKSPPVRLVQGIGIALCLISLLGLLGHLYHVEELYAVPRPTRIAWPTAAGILLLGVGILLARPKHAVMATFTSSSPGGVASHCCKPR